MRGALKRSTDTRPPKVKSCYNAGRPYAVERNAAHMTHPKAGAQLKEEEVR